jgi:hypothetical protein
MTLYSVTSETLSSSSDAISKLKTDTVIGYVITDLPVTMCVS